MFEAFWEQNAGRPGRNTDVACIGLGTGSLSALCAPGEKMTFFEIDWTVRKLVEEDKHYTYISRARKYGGEIDFIMGDARLSLEQTNRKWGFMLVDAFSSDAIPAHLLTQEAIKVYFDHLEDDGLLALHISNRYLNLEEVVECIVRDKYAAIVMHDHTYEGVNWRQKEFSGKLPSTWVLIARKREAFGPLQDDPRWGPLKRDDRVGLWTDDFTPITKAFRENFFATLFNK